LTRDDGLTHCTDCFDAITAQHRRRDLGSLQVEELQLARDLLLDCVDYIPVVDRKDYREAITTLAAAGEREPSAAAIAAAIELCPDSVPDADAMQEILAAAYAVDFGLPAPGEQPQEGKHGT
jgi:hypothetical protein